MTCPSYLAPVLPAQVPKRTEILLVLAAGRIAGYSFLCCLCTKGFGIYYFAFGSRWLGDSGPCFIKLVQVINWIPPNSYIGPCFHFLSIFEVFNVPIPLNSRPNELNLGTCLLRIINPPSKPAIIILHICIVLFSMQRIFEHISSSELQINRYQNPC